MKIWSSLRQGKYQGKNFHVYMNVGFEYLIAFLNFISDQLILSLIPSLIVSSLILALSIVLANRNLLKKLYNRKEGLFESGIDGVYPELPKAYLDNKFRAAEKEIRILQTYIFSPNVLSLGLVEAVKRGIPVKILLMDFQSDILKQRLQDLGFGRNSARAKAAFDTIQKEIVSNSLSDANIQIGFYDGIPSSPLYIIDELILKGDYWHGHESTLTPFIQISGRDSQVGALALETFEKIWSKARLHTI